MPAAHSAMAVKVACSFAYYSLSDVEGHGLVLSPLAVASRYTRQKKSAKRGENELSQTLSNATERP